MSIVIISTLWMEEPKQIEEKESLSLSLPSHDLFDFRDRFGWFQTCSILLLKFYTNLVIIWQQFLSTPLFGLGILKQPLVPP